MRARILLGLAVASLVAAAPLFGRVGPGVLTEQRALSIGIAVSFAAMALSVNVVMGYAGQLSLGHGALAGMGGFASAVLTARGAQLPFLAGLAGAVVAGAAVGGLWGMGARRLRGIWLGVSSLAFAVAMEQAVFRWPAITGRFSGIEVPRPKIGAFVFDRTGDYLGIAVALLAAIWLLDVNMFRSKIGRAVRAVASKEHVAASFGVDRDEALTHAFVVSGAIAGIAGAVFGHLLRFVDAGTFSYQSLSLPLVAVVAVGGIGSRTGIAAAAGAYVILPGVSTSFRGWELVLTGVVLIYVVAAHPSGLAGIVRWRASRRAVGTSEAAPTREWNLLRSWPAGGSPPSLELVDVSVRRGGRLIIDRVSLNVPPGAVVGTIGPNGSGKTTLLDAVSGFVRAETGAVLAFGRDIGDLSVHDRARLGIGRTFDGVGAVDALTVRENLLLAQQRSLAYGTFAALSGIPSMGREEKRACVRADEMADAAGLRDYLNTPARELSFGARRLVELACAFISDAQLLLLDEPTAGLGPEAGQIVGSLLDQIRGSGTVLVVEHNMSLAAAACDRICVLESGRIVAEGPPEEAAVRRMLTLPDFEREG